ncbi:MAG: thioredoxin family protein [Magnetococcales bacterium]|nr:thioredoxin family protein [Magnetococcales bacterium]
MVLLHTPPGELGAPAAPFNLPAAVGGTRSLENYREAKALVVMFLCNHCPYVQAVEDRIIALAKEMTPLGAAFVAISPNDAVTYPEDSFPNMKQRAQEKGYPFDYLFDASQQTAKAYGAVCTPDFFLFDAERKLRYRGRLDDSPRNPTAVRRQDLKEAIQEILSGRTPSVQQAPCMGCSIKWRGADRG